MHMHDANIRKYNWQSTFTLAKGQLEYTINLQNISVSIYTCFTYIHYKYTNNYNKTIMQQKYMIQKII